MVTMQKRLNWNHRPLMISDINYISVSTWMEKKQFVKCGEYARPVAVFTILITLCGKYTFQLFHFFQAVP